MIRLTSLLTELQTAVLCETDLQPIMEDLLHFKNIEMIAI